MNKFKKVLSVIAFTTLIMGQFPAYAYSISKNNEDIVLYTKPYKPTTEKPGNEVVLGIPLKRIVSASICNNILIFLLLLMPQ